MNHLAALIVEARLAHSEYLRSKTVATFNAWNEAHHAAEDAFNRVVRVEDPLELVSCNARNGDPQPIDLGGNGEPL